MPSGSAALLIHCQMALGLTQTQLGDLVGKTKRTIQRWQERGFTPTVDQAEALAAALQPVRPDLAEQMRELARSVAIAMGMAPPPPPVTSEVIDAILRAAAEASGTSPAAIRPAITAALRATDEAGVDLGDLVAALTSAP
jgi:hypothetical protein